MANTVKITSKGREIISGRMIGGSPTQTEPLNIGWGTGGLGTGSPYTAAVTDVNAFKESAENRTAGTSSQVTTSSINDTYQVTGTITSLSNQTIAEVLLSDSSSKPFVTAVAGGSGVIGSAVSTSLNTTTTYTPANNTFIQIDTEVMKVTAGSGTTSLTVQRAQNGTTAISTISAADVVTLGNPPGTSGNNGSMFVHATFTGLALNTNDGINFTVQVQMLSS